MIYVDYNELQENAGIFGDIDVKEEDKLRANLPANLMQISNNGQYIRERSRAQQHIIYWPWAERLQNASIYLLYTSLYIVYEKNSWEPICPNCKMNEKKLNQLEIGICM